MWRPEGAMSIIVTILVLIFAAWLIIKVLVPLLQG